MNRSIGDLLLSTLEEQAENDKITRRRVLKTRLLSFLMLFIAFSIICISAEFDAPWLLFLLAVAMVFLILVKAK